MPNLGQGGCQAIEDAYILTEELCALTDKSQIPAALQSYYRRRIVRSAIVQGMSRLSSDIIISTFSTPFDFEEFKKEGFGYKYLNIKSLMTLNLKTVLPAIFYAQFGYLYSYAPSNFEPEHIKKLVKDSVERNRRECSKIYDNLKEGFVTYFSAKSMSFHNYDKATKEVTTVAEADDFRKSAV